MHRNALNGKKAMKELRVRVLVFDSEVKKILPSTIEIKVPHMGWNNIKLINDSYKKLFSSLVKGDYYLSIVMKWFAIEDRI